MNKLAKKFKRNFALVSCLSKSVTKDAWSIASGASHHMTRTREVFLSVSMTYSDMHVKVGMSTIYIVKGVGTMLF